MELPRTREELVVFALEYKNLRYTFKVIYAQSVHRNDFDERHLMQYKFQKWIDYCYENFPDLCKTVHRYREYQIYIAGVHIETVYT